MAIRSHRMYEKPLMYQSPLCIRCSGDCRKTDALRYMTESAEAGTGVIIMLPQREKKLLKNTAESGRSTRIW